MTLFHDTISTVPVKHQQM